MDSIAKDISISSYNYRNTGITEYLYQGVPVSRSTGIAEYRYHGVRVFLSTGIKEYRYQGVPVSRSTGIREYRYRGVPVSRSTGITEYRYHGVPVLRSTGIKEYRKYNIRWDRKFSIYYIQMNVCYNVIVLKEEIPIINMTGIHWLVYWLSSCFTDRAYNE